MVNSEEEKGGERMLKGILLMFFSVIAMIAIIGFIKVEVEEEEGSNCRKIITNSC